MPRFHRAFLSIALSGLLLTACAPAASPSPTAAPAKPTEAAKPADKPTEAPKPAAPASPAASPAAAASPSPSPAAAAKPAASPAAAAPATKVETRAIEEFYRGKTVRIVVGFAPGGGFDTYARLIARYMGNHIPGNPTIVVENQAGAGSLLAANTVYKTAPKDGTVIVHFIGGMITQKLIVENPAAEFDPMQYNWLGGPTPDTAACAVRKESGFTSLEEARNKELVLGGTAPGSTTDDIPNTLKAIGLNIKIIDGYEGTSRIRLAADSGEVMGGCWGWESISVTWKDALEKNEVVVLGQGGPRPLPDLPNVPMIQSLARNDDERRLIEAGIVAPGTLGRPFALPPGVPADRVQAMRDAFIAVLKDPNLLSEAQRAGIAINPVSSEEFAPQIRALQELPVPLKARLKQALAGQ